MAPLEHDLMPETAEIALARSAAPSSISRAAQVMLQREGYATAVKGESGFVCIVGRAWGKATGNSEFWKPKMRARHCFNPQATRTQAPRSLACLRGFAAFQCLGTLTRKGGRSRKTITSQVPHPSSMLASPSADDGRTLTKSTPAASRQSVVDFTSFRSRKSSCVQHPTAFFAPSIHETGAESRMPGSGCPESSPTQKGPACFHMQALFCGRTGEAFQRQRLLRARPVASQPFFALLRLRSTGMAARPIIIRATEAGSGVAVGVAKL